jgi:hypothetical protein
MWSSQVWGAACPGQEGMTGKMAENGRKWLKMAEGKSRGE